MFTENKSALSALMGTLSPKDKTPITGDNEYPIEFIDRRFKQIVRANSIIKMSVFNMDKPESAAEYSSIVNAQNVQVIKEDTSFATYEEGDMDSKTKDTYYKVALKYSEVDYDKVIAGVGVLIQDSLLSAEMGKGLLLAAFPDLIIRKAEITKKLEKIEEKLLQKKKEETPEGRARRRIKGKNPDAQDSGVTPKEHLKKATRKEAIKPQIKKENANVSTSKTINAN